MFLLSAPYSELCLGSMRAGRGCSGEQACCSTLPAAQMQSLQRAAVCGVPALCSVPGRASGLPQQLCFRHWPSCSFTDRSGWVTVCGRGRGHSRAGLRRENPSACSPALQAGHG